MFVLTRIFYSISKSMALCKSPLVSDALQPSGGCGYAILASTLLWQSLYWSCCSLYTAYTSLPPVKPLTKVPCSTAMSFFQSTPKELCSVVSHLLVWPKCSWRETSLLRGKTANTPGVVHAQAWVCGVYSKPLVLARLLIALPFHDVRSHISKWAQVPAGNCLLMFLGENRSGSWGKGAAFAALAPGHVSLACTARVFRCLSPVSISKLWWAEQGWQRWRL